MASTSGAQVPKAQSRFDAEQWNDQDTINTIRNLSALATRWIEGLDPETAQQRPDASTWSIAEYLSHIGDVMTLVMGGMQLSIDQPGFVIDELPATESIGDQRNVEIDQALTRIHDLGRDAVTLLSKLPSDAWSNAIVVDGESLDVRWASRHIIYDAWHHLGDIADIRRRLGDGVPEQSGEIVQINSSGGGVPKLPVEGPVHVGIRGLDGDTQAALTGHCCEPVPSWNWGRLYAGSPLTRCRVPRTINGSPTATRTASTMPPTPAGAGGTPRCSSPALSRLATQCASASHRVQYPNSDVEQRGTLAW